MAVIHAVEGRVISLCHEAHLHCAGVHFLLTPSQGHQESDRGQRVDVLVLKQDQNSETAPKLS